MYLQREHILEESNSGAREVLGLTDETHLKYWKDKFPGLVLHIWRSSGKWLVTKALASMFAALNGK